MKLRSLIGWRKRRAAEKLTKARALQEEMQRKQQAYLDASRGMKVAQWKNAEPSERNRLAAGFELKLQEARAQMGKAYRDYTKYISKHFRKKQIAEALPYGRIDQKKFIDQLAVTKKQRRKNKKIQRRSNV